MKFKKYYIVNLGYYKFDIVSSHAPAPSLQPLNKTIHSLSPEPARMSTPAAKTLFSLHTRWSLNLVQVNVTSYYVQCGVVRQSTLFPVKSHTDKDTDCVSFKNVAI